MKSYTDLEQSKKLSDILSLDSADYTRLGKNEDNVLTRPYSESCFSELKEWIGENNIFPCWSLVALLEIIKKLVGYSLQSLDIHTVFMNCELGDKPYNIETENYDNPVDACVAMIEKLHELNLL